MKFRIDCPCGRFIEVGEGAAGATFDCECGKPLVVPSSVELRTRAGLPTNAVSPEFVIEHLLPRGEFLASKTCVECGVETDAVLYVVTECERAIRREAGDMSWILLLFSFIFLPIAIWRWREGETREYGRDKIYRLPLRLCKACQPKLNSAARIKQSLSKVVEYRMLLEKFPDANVNIVA